MTDRDRYARLHALFRAARELPVDERDAFLRGECVDDDSLKLEIESLLDLADHENDPLSDGALSSGAQFADLADRRDSPAQPMPEAIGGCRILRRLGSGGMGVVWEAEQIEPHRRVAIKVLGWIASESIVRRFRRESEALAMLKHPGVAQIYDFGVETRSGQDAPYIIMELVEGLPLTAYVRKNALDADACLELMADVCGAVEHAHQRGVIHRDLKPDNILVEPSGQPKVLDFGIARITQDDMNLTRETEVGQVVGTAAYMSPEQAAGDSLEIDTRSDVYSLGAIAYELLSGQPPHAAQGGSLVELLNAIRESTPMLLGRTDPRLRGDVETIVAKALEKDKDRRYQSAGELAEDIRRYLNDLPIVAHAPSAIYQLKKYAKRNRLLMTSLAIVVLSLAAGFGATGVALSRESRQRARAEAELLRANTALAYLESTLLSVTPTEAAGLDTALMRTILDRAATRVDEQLHDQPEIQAQMLSLFGRAYGRISEFALSVEFLERSMALFEDVHGAASPERIQTMYALGGTHRMAGDFEQASEVIDSAMRLQPGAAADDADLFDLLLERGQISVGMGDFEEALRHADEAIQLLAVAAGSTDEGRVRTLRGHALRHLGRPDEAMAEYEASRDIYEDAGLINTIEFADVTNSLALIHRRRNAFAEAEQLYKQAITIRLSIDSRPDPGVAAMLNNFGRVLIVQQKTDEAAEIVRQSVDMHEALFGKEHFGTAIAIVTLAEVRGQQGRLDDSLELYDEGLVLMRSLLGPDHPHLATLASNKCIVLCQAERFDEAVPILDDALRIVEARDLPPVTYRAPLLLRKAQAMYGLGRHDEADRIGDEALACFAPDDPRREAMREALAAAGSADKN